MKNPKILVFMLCVISVFGTDDEYHQHDQDDEFGQNAQNAQNDQNAQNAAQDDEIGQNVVNNQVAQNEPGDEDAKRQHNDEWMTPKEFCIWSTKWSAIITFLVKVAVHAETLIPGHPCSVFEYEYQEAWKNKCINLDEVCRVYEAMTPDNSPLEDCKDHGLGSNFMSNDNHQLELTAIRTFWLNTVPDFIGSKWSVDYSEMGLVRAETQQWWDFLVKNEYKYEWQVTDVEKLVEKLVEEVSSADGQTMSGRQLQEIFFSAGCQLYEHSKKCEDQETGCSEFDWTQVNGNNYAYWQTRYGPPGFKDDGSSGQSTDVFVKVWESTNNSSDDDK